MSWCFDDETGGFTVAAGTHPAEHVHRAFGVDPDAHDVEAVFHDRRGSPAAQTGAVFTDSQLHN
jgi:hypothetical protein